VPFVQGQLRKEHLSIRVETQCAHCGQPIEIEIDSDLKYRVLPVETQDIASPRLRESAGGAETQYLASLPAQVPDPVIFAPMVDFERLKDPSIIDAF